MLILHFFSRFFSTTRRPPLSTLFPYTTLFRSVVLLPFQLLRLSLATPSRWTPLALSVFLHCVVALLLTKTESANGDRKSSSAGMPRPISYAVFCLKKKKKQENCRCHEHGRKHY